VVPRSVVSEPRRAADEDRPCTVIQGRASSTESRGARPRWSSTPGCTRHFARRKSHPDRAGLALSVSLGATVSSRGVNAAVCSSWRTWRGCCPLSGGRLLATRSFRPTQVLGLPRSADVGAQGRILQMTSSNGRGMGFGAHPYLYSDTAESEALMRAMSVALHRRPVVPRDSKGVFHP
jgi:hypothetical protein